jgi:uncharacterized membrane protein
MGIAYFIVAGLVALVSFAVGILKLVRTREQLQAMGQAWTADFTDLQVRLIGAAEVLGAVGLIVPMATGILPVLSPIAGIGIAVIQAGAFVTHARRAGERQNMIGNMVVFALAGAAAVLGFLVLAG